MGYSGLTYGIIGAGRLGMSLALALGNRLLWAVSRGGHQNILLSDQSIVASLLENVSLLPDCLILTVSDASIADVAQTVAKTWGNHLAGKFIIHCSGALPRDMLVSCHEQGAHTLILHPFQTFAFPSVEAFAGIAWGIEAEEEDEDFARQLVQSLGGKPFVLPVQVREHKALYHVSATVAANYLTMLTVFAGELAEVAGVPSQEFLPPIMRTALENALASLPSGNSPVPLTGPIARGDAGTIRAHLQALREFPSLFRSYCLLGRATAQLAQEHGLLSEQQFETLSELFEE